MKPGVNLVSLTGCKYRRLRDDRKLHSERLKQKQKPARDPFRKSLRVIHLVFPIVWPLLESAPPKHIIKYCLLMNSNSPGRFLIYILYAYLKPAKYWLEGELVNGSEKECQLLIVSKCSAGFGTENSTAVEDWAKPFSSPTQMASSINSWHKGTVPAHTINWAGKRLWGVACYIHIVSVAKGWALLHYPLQAISLSPWLSV